MEDQPHQLPQINGEDFYEKIEAPKFVDFTVPNRRPPDDRYWFCLRVGCDQKHEEELNAEEIEKNFVLRVMAARSPNIRFRKALSREQRSSSMKCPLTAPAKPSKSRISRLAVISSISPKLVDEKHETRSLSKLNATPKTNLKESSSVAKAFTTPRNRKRVSNPDKFRSVRSPKATNIAVPKTRAKALVFHSPKKAVRIKTSTELKTPVRKLCAAMTKLEIASGKKQPLESKTPMGKSCAAMSKVDIAREKKQLALPSGTTTQKQFRGREVKSRVFDSLNSHNHKGQEVKVLKNVKRKKKEKDLDEIENENCSSDMEIDKERSSDMEVKSRVFDSLNSHNHKGQEVKVLKNVKRKKKEKDLDEIENENCSSDMEIDKERSRGGLLEGCSQSDGKTKGNEECLKAVKTSEPRCDEHSVEASSETSREDLSTLPSCEERPSGDSDQVITRDTSDHAEEIKSREEKESSPEDEDNDEKENSFPSDDKENDGENDGENESDEKENASSSDGNREPNVHSEGEILGNHDTKKDNQGIKKTLKKNATVAQEAKYKKPKPTNPKPFRLRTDERGILKETNLEKKLLTPLKEITSSVKPSGKSLRKHPTLSQINEDDQGQSKNENVSPAENGKIVDQPGRAKNCSRTSKGNLEQKSSPAMHSRRRLLSSITEKKSSERIASSRKTARLGVKKERSTVILRHKEIEKPCENGASPARNSRASASTAPRTVSRGRRPTTTFPKEPNFHSIHVPKSCTKKVA